MEFADFKIIRDSAFSLAVGADIDRTIGPVELPETTLVDQLSVLSFMVREVEDAQLQLQLNGTDLFAAAGGLRLGTSNQVRCIQEVCPSGILRTGANNRIHFRVIRGSCSLADIVLWFRSESR